LVNGIYLRIGKGERIGEKEGKEKIIVNAI
jgi:hypothetical protein